MKSLVVIAVLFCSYVLFSSSLKDNILDAVDAVEECLPREGKRSWPEYIIEFGYRYRDNQAYPKMAELVSNNFEYVYANFSDLATNAVQRLILLSGGWAYDEDYYIESYSKILDLAIAGDISEQEFRWFESAGRPLRTTSILAYRYKEPRVREIVYRYLEYSGNTNRCEYILSGNAKRDSLLYKLETSELMVIICKWGCLLVIFVACLLFFVRRICCRQACRGQG